LDTNDVLVLDAGTGIRELGKVLETSDEDIFVLLSHQHWDHIQGFPFFSPIYQPDREVYVFPPRRQPAAGCSVLEQMDGDHFPLTPDKLPSQTLCITQDVVAFLRDRDIAVTQVATNHPGGGSGYRIEHGGRSVVYLTDNELEPPSGKATEFAEFVHFCQHADVLIHDAQYLAEDMPRKHGWGHSLVGQACALAVAAKVKHLILFHHDPDRSDAQLDQIQESVCAWLCHQDLRMQCTVAWERLSVSV
jgi:phosphoribosyl 1,2-cyclic phosphodiesterase